MLDEKLTDQVWVTVVATGYGEARPRPVRREEPGGREQSRQGREYVREPGGEPRVRRVRDRPLSAATELDVPEFMPRR
jgi:cell division protein FtsZ